MNVPERLPTYIPTLHTTYSRAQVSECMYDRAQTLSNARVSLCVSLCLRLSVCPSILIGPSVSRMRPKNLPGGSLYLFSAGKSKVQPMKDKQAQWDCYVLYSTSATLPLCEFCIN